MRKFCVELRSNRGSEPGRGEIEGYIATFGDGNYDGPVRYGCRGVASIRDTSYIPFFASERACYKALATLPAAFFDRFAADIVEMTESE